MLSSWHVMFLFSLLLVFILKSQHRVSGSIVVKSREEMENKLKELYGDAGPLPDFTFYTKTQLDNYTDVNITPLGRTEKRTRKPVPKTRSEVERILATALNALNRGAYVEELTWASKFVVLALSGKKSKSLKILKNLTVKKSARPKRSASKAIEDLKDNLFGEVVGKLDENIDDLQQEEQSLKHDGRLVNYERSLMSNDAVTFTYTGTQICFGEGSQGTSSSVIRLCATCSRQIDFGQYVLPRYAYSVECVDSASVCLNGDGACTQKVIYYTFQKFTGYGSWQPYQQYLNTTCECECLSGSLVDQYFVGSSN